MAGKLLTNAVATESDGNCEGNLGRLRPRSNHNLRSAFQQQLHENGIELIEIIGPLLNPLKLR